MLFLFFNSFAKGELRMADKLLVCCMDPRFFDATHKFAQELFGVDSQEFYVLALAGGPKFLADIDRFYYDGVPDNYKELLFTLKWNMDQGMRSIKIFCEANPKGTILLVAHLDTCKGYEYEGMLRGFSEKDEESFQFQELKKAARTIQRKCHDIKLIKKVAKLEKGAVVFF